jgi:integrase/recombinase XerD
MLKKHVEYLTLAEAESIKRAADIVFEKSNHKRNDEWIRDRDKLLLSIMWTTGARISDILSFTDKSINFTKKTATFLVKKRHDPEALDGLFWLELSLDIETLSELMAYIHTWSIRGYLFRPFVLSESALTRQAVAKKVKQLAVIAGLPRDIHCHMYRHGLAMHMQAQGAYAEVIAYRLGHSSTQVTLSTYARLDANQERQILENTGVRLR